MYNKSYISEFTESEYIDALNDTNKLEIISNEYTNRYKGKSNALYLAFKESLDHYVLYRIVKDNNFIYSKEFINYKDYIYNVLVNNKLEVNDNIYCNMEFNTNIVFRNPNIRKLIFDTYFISEEEKKMIETKSTDILRRLKYCYDLLEKNERLNIAQLTFLGEYFHNTRDFDSIYFQKYIEYILNKVPKNKSVPLPIMNSILSYLPYAYKDDERVANTRMFICSHDSHFLKYNNIHDDTIKYKTKNGDTFRKIANVYNLNLDFFEKKYPDGYNNYGPDGTLPEDKIITIKQGNDFKTAHSSGEKKYCCFKNELLKKTTFDDESLNYNRTYDYNDLYFWIYVSFHELTHQHQKYESQSVEINSSGLSAIIKGILDKKFCDYGRNHDSSENEMEADENGWSNTLNFLHKYIGFSKMRNENDSIEHDYYTKCLTNINDVHARRAFSYKINEKGKEIFYSTYDLINLKIIVKNNPNLLNQFPMLKKLFTVSGDLKPDIMFLDKIAVDSSRFNENYSGIEIGKFLLEDQDAYNMIKNRLIQNDFSNEELNYLRSNIYHICHQNILKLRELLKINTNAYDQTNTHFDFNNIEKIKNMYFKNLFVVLFRARDLQIIMQQKNPNYDYEKEFREHYMPWFIEACQNIKIFSIEKLEKYISNYEKTNDSCLLELADYSRDYLMNRVENENNLIDFPSFDEIKELALKYYVDVDINNPTSIEIKSRDADEIVDDVLLRDKALFANIWLQSAGVKYMQNDSINGLSYAFNDKAKELYERLFSEILSKIANNNNIEIRDLINYTNNVVSYKYNTEIIYNLFKTDFQNKFLYKFIKETQTIVKKDDNIKIDNSSKKR